MVKIAITGGIACGKSLVGETLAGAGIAVCDSDALAHACLEPGTPVHAAVVAAFGDDIVGVAGGIDRMALGERVFNNAECLARLNAIVHPSVKAAWEAWLTRQTGPAGVVVPLLYEAGYGDGWTAVICVCASQAVQMKRLAGRGIGPRQAELRIRSQWSNERKAAQADYVIWNDGSKDVLHAQAQVVLKDILGGE